MVQIGKVAGNKIDLIVNSYKNELDLIKIKRYLTLLI